MSLTLHLGVLDINHRNVQAGKKGKKSTRTTGDIAEILESKYHIMRIFLELHEKDIVRELEEGLQRTHNTILGGGPIDLDAFGEGTSKITAMMKDFLANKEMEKIGYPGVPTKAALKGVNHRLKHPYSKRNPKPRASFIDTGQYQAAMKAWIDSNA